MITHYSKKNKKMIQWEDGKDGKEEAMLFYKILGLFSLCILPVSMLMAYWLAKNMNI